MQLQKPLFLILHNLRSIHNVGSIFRTADAAGVSKIYLVGITPTPLDRFGNPRKDFAKTALGAEHSMPWESAKSFSILAKKLKKDGVEIVALEQGRSAISYTNYVHQKPVALVVGNEVDGISAKDQKLCDVVIEIPMVGKKESLNVGVATGIALFRIVSVSN